MRAYISGPMSGIEGFNRPVFQEAASALRAEGLEVTNPADLEIFEGSWTDYMREDIRLLTECDTVYVLAGWDQSRGACVEVTIASALGLQIIDFATRKPISESEKSIVLAYVVANGKAGESDG